MDKTLDTKNEKVDLLKIIYKSCECSSSNERNSLLYTLLNFKDLLDRSLGEYQMKSVLVELESNATLCYAKPLSIP